MQRVIDRPVLYLEHHLANLGLARRIAVVERPADHRGDDAVFADLAAIERLDRPAVADDGHMVGDAIDLIELVRNEDGGDALPLEFEQQVEQRLAVLLAEAGGRLVEDKELDLLAQRLGDFDQLLLADADIGDQRARIFRQPDLGEQGPRSVFIAVPVDDAEPGLLITEENVLVDRQHRHQRQFLMDDDDADMLAVMDAFERHLLAAIDDLAVIGAGRIDAREDFHQRRFAGAVFADHCMDLALFDGEVHIRERFDAWKRLGDAAHLQNRRSHGSAVLRPRPMLAGCPASEKGPASGGALTFNRADLTSGRPP